MATIADLEATLRNVLSGATGVGLTTFDETVQEILNVGRINFNEISGVKNSLDNAVGEGTLSFAETIRVMLSVVQSNTNALNDLNFRLAALEARIP